jgi:hypothetical protein
MRRASNLFPKSWQLLLINLGGSSEILVVSGHKCSAITLYIICKFFLRLDILGSYAKDVFSQFRLTLVIRLADFNSRQVNRMIFLYKLALPSFYKESVNAECLSYKID